MSDFESQGVESGSDFRSEIADSVVQLASAYLSHNHTTVGEISNLMQTLQTEVATLYRPAVAPEPEPIVVGRSEPAVPADESIFDDYIICLNDGKRFKSLKRHIRTAFGLEPDAYRRMWGLPADYPMVAPAYAAARSSLAKDMGLGRKSGGRKRRVVQENAPAATAPSTASADFPEGIKSLEDTITPDGIVCLEDGKVTKNLERHLKTVGMTREDYATKWNLPANYPFTSAEAAKQQH